MPNKRIEYDFMKAALSAVLHETAHSGCSACSELSGNMKTAFTKEQRSEGADLRSLPAGECRTGAARLSAMG